MNLYTDVNLKQNEVQFAVIHPLANAPSGVEGQVYYNTTDDTLYMHDGTQWKPVGVRYEIEYGQATDSIALNLVGSDGNTDTVYLKGAGGATLSVNGDTLTITSKDYPIGTKSQLETGTSQSESVWTPEILHDYIMDRIGEIPADQFLDLNKTEFVQNFSWSAVLYPGSTDPNLDGKPVLVLALTDGDTTAYSFLNMESLISAYTGTAPINVNGSVISLNDSGATAGSFGDANNMTPSWGESFKALFATINSKGLATLVSEHNVTIPDTVASATSKGLMSAEDKQKLDLLSPVSYTQVTGKPTSDQEPDFGDTVTVSQISQATSGQVSALDRTIKIPDTLASDTNDGLMSAEDKDKLDNVDDIYNTECGDIVTIDDAQPDSNITSLQVTLEPVQEGTGTPSFENVRPIIGYESVDANVTGKNLCYKTVTGFISPGTDYAVFNSSSGTTLIFNCKAGQTYVFSGADINRAVWGVWSAEPTTGEQTTDFLNFYSSVRPITFTPTKSGVCLLYINNGTVDTSNAQIEIGTTATDFAPYTGSSYNVPLWSTVYSGTPDLAKGTGQSMLGSITYYGYEDWQDWTDYRFYLAELPEGFDVSRRGEILTNEKVANDTQYAYGNYCAYGSSGFYINKEYAGQTLEELINKLSESPLQVVYPLATPYELSFPPQKITLNEGENNIWSDGDICVTYIKDRGELGEFIADTQKRMLKHFVDGNASGSVRGINTTEEDDNYSLGYSAFAQGQYTKASGDCSHAEGEQTTASQVVAHAEGYHTQATASYTHAEGYYTTASHESAHAEGYSTTASDRATHAEGRQTTASQDYAHAEGYQSTASGDASHAEGEESLAAANDSHAEGYSTEARARASHAEGYDTKVQSGIGSHAEGYQTLANVNNTGGYGAHAEGYLTQATTGHGAHAEGESTTAGGYSSHAEGYGTSVTAIASVGAHAEGYETIAEQDGAHAEGKSTRAAGVAAHAEGHGTKAMSSYQHVFGKYNQEDSGERYVELVGNGTSSARSNARSLDWYGNEILAGKLTVGTDPVYNRDVTTKQYVDARVPTPYTRTLSASGWSASNTQTVNITGLTTSSTVIVSPDPTSMDDYVSAGVKCTAQASGYLTFTCDTVPSVNLTVNIIVVG